jgi:hypothetical protein
VALAAPLGARAGDLCKARVLMDVPAREDPTSVLHKGAVDDAVTQYVVDRKTGEPVLLTRRLLLPEISERERP